MYLGHESLIPQLVTQNEIIKMVVELNIEPADEFFD